MTNTELQRILQHRDQAFNSLVDEVRALFGDDAYTFANNRAYDKAAEWERRIGDAYLDSKECWVGVFHDALKAELRQLLRRH